MDTWKFPVTMPRCPNVARLNRMAKNLRKEVENANPAAIALVTRLSIANSGSKRFSLNLARLTVAKVCCLSSWESLEVICADPDPKAPLTRSQLSDILETVATISPESVADVGGAIARIAETDHAEAQRLLVRSLGYRHRVDRTSELSVWFPTSLAPMKSKRRSKSG